MNQAQGAAATGESDETTLPPTAASGAPETGTAAAKEQGPAQGEVSATPTRLGALLEGMDLPPEVLAQVTPKEQEKKEEEPEEEAEPEEEQQPEEEQPEEGAAPPAAEAEEDHVPEEWPQSAKARVQQEAEKRRKWKATAEQLQGELNQARGGQPQPVTVAPSVADPLANVLDMATLAQVQADWQEILDFTEDNPDGAYDVLTGKDAQGNEKRRDYSADDIKEMRRKARPILRAVPAREKYLQTLAVETQHARKSYPEMFTEGSEFNKEASELLNAFPEMRRVPDFLSWLGDAVAGRKMRLAKAGKTPSGKPLSATAQAILQAPKVTPAPGTIKARSHEAGPRSRSSGVDQKQARETFEKRNFSPEGLDDFVSDLRKGQQSGKGPKQRALV